MEKGEILLEIRNMCKRFGPITALRNVDLTIRRGEIHGLIGENGSGKSTITSIASGMQKATSGEMFYKGQPWDPESMVEAQRKGISMILQEMNTINNCTVAENLFAGQEDRFSRFGFCNTRKMNQEADKILKKFYLDYIRGKDPINRYSFEERKLIEIARTVTDDTEILVVDETTTALSFEGREHLYRLMKEMADAQKAVVFISHDMEEILSKCTILTVLRDGEIRGTISREEMDKESSIPTIRKLMVGRDIGNEFYRSDYDSSHQEETALELKDASFGPIRNISISVHKGEIVGLGGLSGCGMHEIGKAAFGLIKPDSGTVTCKGKEIHSPREAVASGMGYISKDRDQEALITQASIEDNIVMPSLEELRSGPFVLPATQHRFSDEQIRSLEVKCTSGKQWVNTLSGGNKQKVSVAKWIAKGSDVLIMDCPTRGVDIGVKQSMYHLITEMKKNGKAILMISEEMSELIGMADRILVLKDFSVQKEFERSPSLSETDIIEYMI